MKLRLFIISVLLVGLSGCVTTSPEQLLSIEPVPQGQGNKTGEFPTIGQVPQGNTAQLSKSEVAAAKDKITQDAQEGRDQAAGNNEADYQAEVEALKRLAEEQKAKRQADIESRQF